MLTPSIIHLDDYAYAGEGACGESYYHRTDEHLMLKLYYQSARYSTAENEYVFSRKAYEAGVPTPRPMDFVTDGNGRFGLLFEKIKNKKSFARAVSEEPQQVEHYARQFAQMCLDLHATILEKSQFPSAKNRYLKMLDENPFFTSIERQWTRNFIKNIPDTYTALHGDLQFGNALLSDSGNYFIDLGDFAYGHPYIDLGKMLLCSCFASPDFIKECFHLETSTAKEFWKFFVQGYFGNDADLESVTKMIRPYAELATLQVEHVTGCKILEYHKFIG